MKVCILFRFQALIALSTTLIVTLSGLASHDARADDPVRILKAMTEYLANQKSLSASFESDIEVITPELQKIQFASSGEMKVSRPDKLRVRRTGGYADVELIYDGKMMSLYGNNVRSYVQADLPGTVDMAIDTVRSKLGVGIPGANFLLANAYDDLMADVIDSKHIGAGVIDGVECEHLAFRGPDADWQIWIENGAQPLPRKYVITSKTLTGAPQYTLRMKDWKTDAQADTDAFVFKPPAGATRVSIESDVVLEFDELPPGAPIGARQ